MTTRLFRWRISITLAVFAAVVVWYASANGIGLSPDSMDYLEAARSVLRGEGMVVAGTPMTHFPPLYPLLLAGVAHLPSNLLLSARLLHCLLFAVVVFVVGWTTWVASNRSTVASVVTMTFTLAAAGVVEIHLMAYSEPLFLVLALAALLALDRSLRTDSIPWLVVSGLLMAAVTLTRYVGITVVVAGVAGLLRFRSDSPRRTARDVVVVLIAACAPVALWLLRNLSMVGSTTDRSFAFHPPDLEAWRLLAYSISYWAFPLPVLPQMIRALVVVGFAVVVTVTVLQGLRSNTDPPDASHDGGGLRFLLAAWCITYTLMLLVSRTFFDAHTKFDNRILSPILIGAAIIGFSAIFSHDPSDSGRTARRLIVIGWIGALVMNPAWTVQVLHRGHTSGFGYANTSWRESEALALVRRLGAGTPIYSNGAEVIRVLLDRPAAMIPRTRFAGSLDRNPNFESQLQRMEADLVTRDGVLIVLDRIDRDYLPTPGDLEADMDLVVVRRVADGTVFRVRSRSP
jgi:hypothetical protein